MSCPHENVNLLHLECNNKGISKSKLKKLLKIYSFDSKTKDKNISIMEIVCANENNNLNIVKFLFARGVLLNNENSLRFSSLHCALHSKKPKEQVVQFLIEKKCSLLSEDIYRRTPLHIALMNKYITTAILDYLFKQTDNNLVSLSSIDSYKLLMSTFDTRKKKVAKNNLIYLIERGVSINSKNKHGLDILATLILNECKNLDQYLLEFFLEHGFDAQQTYNDGEEQLNVVDLLMNSNLCETENLIKSIILHDFEIKHNDKFKYLLTLTNDSLVNFPLVHYRNEEYKKEISFTPSIGYELIDFVFGSIFDINTKNSYGNTILHIAMTTDTCILPLNILHYMIEKGIDLNSVNDHGDTALHLLLSNKNNYNENPIIFKYLLLSGADISIKNNKTMSVDEILSTNDSSIIYKNALEEINNFKDQLFYGHKFIYKYCDEIHEIDKLHHQSDNPLLNTVNHIDKIVMIIFQDLDSPYVTPHSLNYFINQSSIDIEKLVYIKNENLFHLIAYNSNIALEHITALITPKIISLLKSMNDSLLSPILIIFSMLYHKIRIDKEESISNLINTLADYEYDFNVLNADTKESLLHYYSFLKYPSKEMLNLMIKNGALVNGLDCVGRTPLIYALSNKNVSPEYIKQLIYLKADLNTNEKNPRYSPILFASTRQEINKEIIFFMIENGASPFVKSDNEKNLLDILLCRDIVYVDLIEYLIKNDKSRFFRQNLSREATNILQNIYHLNNAHQI